METHVVIEASSIPRRELRHDGRESQDVIDAMVRDADRDRARRIRCPKCGYSPRKHDRWVCTCGCVWNTFDTRGKCPECSLQWKDTACPRCEQWSVEGTFSVAGIRGELLVAQERVGDAEREIERGDAHGAREQLVEQLPRAPAGRIVREQAGVHARRVDAVAAPVGRVRGDRDDLSSLVARAPRSAEVHADDRAGGGRHSIRFSPCHAAVFRDRFRRRRSLQGASGSHMLPMMSFLDFLFREPSYRSAQAPRTHQRYFAIVGGNPVDCGITSRELWERERERRREMRINNVYLVPVGPRVTEAAARRWERRMRCSPF